MLGIRGDWSRGALTSLLVATALLLSGCATASPPGGAASPSPASPTPTAACPQVAGVELPPGCAPYDPEHAMAQNDRHRERIDLPADALAAAEDSVIAVRPALEALHSEGTLTAEAVEDALTDAGLTGVQARGEHTVVFAADGPDGGCIFGSASEAELRIEAGGYIMDGGCLPAN